MHAPVFSYLTGTFAAAADGTVAKTIPNATCVGLPFQFVHRSGVVSYSAVGCLRPPIAPLPLLQPVTDSSGGLLPGASAAAATAAAVRCRWVAVEVLSFNSCRTSMVAYLQRQTRNQNRSSASGSLRSAGAECSAAEV